MELGHRDRPDGGGDLFKLYGLPAAMGPTSLLGYDGRQRDRRRHSANRGSGDGLPARRLGRHRDHAKPFLCTACHCSTDLHPAPARRTFPDGAQAGN